MPTPYTTDSYIKIFYTTAFGVHSHTVPCRPIVTVGLGDPGSVETWGGDDTGPDTMAKALIDKLMEVVPATTSYNKYVLYKWQPAEFYYAPFFEESYGGAGTAVGLSGQAKANQNTLSIRTAGFSLLKLVLLDRPNNNTWGNQSPVPSDYAEVVEQLTSPDQAWSGRDNTRPVSATNVTISQNKRLRRKYGMI